MQFGGLVSAALPLTVGGQWVVEEEARVSLTIIMVVVGGG